jgi:putative phage-type endonuclease
MKTYNCLQGSQEWLYVRAGIPTASQFDRIVTPTCRKSSQRSAYMYELLAERLMGRPTVKHINWWMERGSTLEERAITFYEFNRDMDTTAVGFVTTDDGRLGASPDRLVSEDGCLEVKCPSEAVHMSYLMAAEGACEMYSIQVQGQLFVTDRLWSDVLSWHPDLPPALVRIERNTEMIMKMRPLLYEFSDELERLAVLLQETPVWSKSLHERKLTAQLKESLMQVIEKNIDLP